MKRLYWIAHRCFRYCQPTTTKMENIIVNGRYAELTKGFAFIANQTSIVSFHGSLSLLLEAELSRFHVKRMVVKAHNS